MKTTFTVLVAIIFCWNLGGQLATNDIPPFPLPVMKSLITAAELREQWDAAAVELRVTNAQPEVKALLAELELTKQEVVAFEAEVFAANPLLAAVEQYREVPRRWFEDHHYDKQVTISQHHSKASESGDKELTSSLMKIATLTALLASREIIREPIFSKITDATYSKFPAKALGNRFSAVDKIIGYKTTTEPPSVLTSGSAAKEVDARSEAIQKAIRDLQTKHGISDEFVEATKIKARMTVTIDLCDAYIAFHLPPELKRSRGKVKQLRAALSRTLAQTGKAI